MEAGLGRFNAVTAARAYGPCVWGSTGLCVPGSGLGPPPVAVLELLWVFSAFSNAEKSC